MSSSLPAPDGRARLTAPLVLLTCLAATSLGAAVWRCESAIAAVSLVLLLAGVTRLRRQPPPATRHRAVAAMARGAVNLALVACSVAVAVGGAEWATRWLYRDVTSTADFRGYFTLKWMRAQVAHNHYGYRGPEFDEIKAPGVYRVAVMGDSFTYGNGLPASSRFTEILGDAVRRDGVEVLNFGFPGNNWSEHVTTLERRVLRLRPDFVLLQWGSNDIELDRDVAARPRVPSLLGDRDWHEWLHEHSALYTILNARWVSRQVQRQMGDTYDRYLARLYASPESEGARHADTSFHRIIDLCRERGVGLGLLLFPDAAVPLGPEYPYAFMHQQVETICRAEGVRCLDLRDTLAEVPDRFQLWVTPLDSHPSALANRLAADQVLTVFAPGWRHDTP